MAIVFQARDVRLDRDVAIKVLYPRSARDVDLRVRFEREAKAIAALSHPNIRAIYDVTRESGRHFAVMELLEGETLRDRLSRGWLEWSQSVDIAMAVSHGLAAAHDKGIIHRDIKPGNIFLTNDGNVKILDFGLALLIADGSDLSYDADACRSTKTSPGKLLGTVNYMSPEQVRGQVADARSDLFSLGAVLYEMIAGAAPFCRKTPADTMAAILHEDPPQLSGLKHGISDDLDAVVYQCLSKSLNDRFQSASDLRQALCGVAIT
jgi:serine/threonine protein kinase